MSIVKKDQTERINQEMKIEIVMSTEFQDQAAKTKFKTLVKTVQLMFRYLQINRKVGKELTMGSTMSQ